MYNPEARADVNFAPTDWEVPTYFDFETLGTTVGNNANAIREAGTDSWNTDTGTNTTGFSAKGGGEREAGTGAFRFLKEDTYFGLNDDLGGDLWVQDNDALWYQNSQQSGEYVRLIYRGAGTPTTVVDFDGNIYDVVLIGTQYFTVQNWKCSKNNLGVTIPNVTDNTTWANLTTPGLCAYNNDESIV